MDKFHMKPPSIDMVRTILDEFNQADVVDLELMFSFMNTIQKVFMVMEKHFSRYNLSKGKFLVLMTLYSRRDSDPIVLSDLAKQIEVTKSTITGLIDGLEKMKYVERYKEPNFDRRKIFIRLTEDGVNFINKMFPDHLENLKGIWHKFEQEDKKNFAKYLRLIHTNLDNFLKLIKEEK